MAKMAEMTNMAKTAKMAFNFIFKNSYNFRARGKFIK